MNFQQKNALFYYNWAYTTREEKRTSTKQKRHVKNSLNLNRFLILMTMTSFSDLGLDTWLRKQLESVRIVKPSPIQVCTATETFEMSRFSEVVSNKNQRIFENFNQLFVALISYLTWVMFADQLRARDPRRCGLHRRGADRLWKDVGVRVADHSGTI